MRMPQSQRWVRCESGFFLRFPHRQVCDKAVRVRVELIEGCAAGSGSTGRWCPERATPTTPRSAWCQKISAPTFPVSNGH